MKKLMMTLAAAFAAAAPLMAETETVGDYTWTYRINGGTAEIFNGGTAAISPKPTGAVAIPTTLGDKPVTSIGNGAFIHCGELTGVTIPSDVTSIGDSAFSNCGRLTDVTIPNGVTAIGYGAFYNCRGLTSVMIPDSVMRIGNYAFADCRELKTIRLPRRFDHLDSSVFAGCTVQTIFYDEPTYVIVFHRNDGSDEMVEAYTFDYGVATRLPSLTKLGWAKRGFDFLGWATSKENAAAGKVWKKDWSIVATAVEIGESMDVYAVWAMKDDSYAIQFIRNDGAGTWRMVGFTYDEKTRLPSVANGLKWARRGYDFKGWALSTADANAGKIWKADWSYVTTATEPGQTLTVYAVWELKPGYYMIRFNKNDGTDKWRSLGFSVDASTKLSTIAALGWERPGYTFVGWASSKANADAGKVWKTDGDTVTNATTEGKTLNIYAIWQ